MVHTSGGDGPVWVRHHAVWQTEETSGSHLHAMEGFCVTTDRLGQVLAANQACEPADRCEVSVRTMCFWEA